MGGCSYRIYVVTVILTEELIGIAGFRRTVAVENYRSELSYMTYWKLRSAYTKTMSGVLKDGCMSCYCACVATATVSGCTCRW